MTRSMWTLVLIGAAGALDDALVKRVAAAAGGGPVRWLSPGEAAELPCPVPPDMAAITSLIGTAAIDIAIVPTAKRRKRLLIADMDSTIVTGETLDELAAFAGVGDHVAAITRRSMNGELDFATALRERVALLQGLDLSALERTWQGVRLTPGARVLVHTMKSNGATTALVSGGFTWFTGRVAALCGFDAHHANILLHDGHALTGKVGEPILDREAKLATMLQLAAKGGFTAAECLAVGDGANDLAMIRAAGLGVAFRAKAVVAAEADARIQASDLRALLFLQGYAKGDFLE